MTQDPNPYRPNFKRADSLPKEQPPPRAITHKDRHSEPMDVCPIRDKDGYCEDSKTGRPQGPFSCTSGKSYRGCGIYIEHRKKESEKK
ncbi:unnamed protein product [marine sediment metagenome]|uniref:Uncharacterized protein n=1 Tax=marine sediment metagenome TaxID=412755 RepID=X0THL0_9ZZZZ